MDNPLKYFAELRDPRVERRKCSVIADPGLIENASEWASLQAMVRIE